MSLHEYQVSQKISEQDPPFYALIMAAFRTADTHNLEKLQRTFPGKWREFEERYNAPGGRLGEELLEQVVEELPETILGREVIVEEVSSREIHLTLGGLDVTGWLKDKKEEYPEGEQLRGPQEFFEKYFGPPEGYFRKDDEKAWSSEGERHQNIQQVFEHTYGPSEEFVHPLCPKQFELDYDHRKKEKEQSSLAVDTHHSETQLDRLLFDLNFESSKDYFKKET